MSVLPGCGCSETAAPRAQLLVVIDTDAHVVGELGDAGTPRVPAGDGGNARVSPDAAIDTVRIDVLDDQNRLVDIRTFPVSDPSAWPLSFGIEPSAAFGKEVRIWMRAFRSLFASSSSASNGVTTLEPPREVTIDRLLALPLPTSGVQRVRITLHEDCLGTPSSFASQLATCLSASQLQGNPDGGLDEGDVGAPSAVGTWRPAGEVECKGTPPSGRVCIPGGFFILGDANDLGLGETPEYEPVPLRPIVMSPFQLDKTEFTVGRFRALVQSGQLGNVMLPTPMTPPDPNDNQFCTWLGPSNASHDNLPLNCVPYPTAKAACQLVGGTLPTEAQWEFAARGRGERRTFAWGEQAPQCCSASLNRIGAPALPGMCPEAGLEPVGSHPPSPSCGGIGDVSLDGVLDMVGSVTEYLADALQPYSGPCWNPGGILHNPSCTMTDMGFSMRGDYWNGSFGSAVLALRNSVSTMGSPSAGFRCAYPDGAQ
jgi:formylglycine-generating enzyme required for sulfatase activity